MTNDAEFTRKLATATLCQYGCGTRHGCTCRTNAIVYGLRHTNMSLLLPLMQFEGMTHCLGRRAPRPPWSMTSALLPRPRREFEGDVLRLGRHASARLRTAMTTSCSLPSPRMQSASTAAVSAMTLFLPRPAVPRRRSGSPRSGAASPHAPVNPPKRLWPQPLPSRVPPLSRGTTTRRPPAALLTGVSGV